MLFESVAWAAETAEHGTEAAHHAEGGAPHILNIIAFLQKLFPDSHFVHFLHQHENILFTVFCAILISFFCWLGARHRQMIPRGLQNCIEMLFEGLDKFVCGIIGPKGTKYTPFVGSVFLYILINNLMGVVPLMHSATSAFTTTLPIALAVFFYVQLTGIRELGLGGYLHHLVGSPNDLIGWMLAPLLLILHVIGELARPLSLALRLFGNISGEHVLMAIFMGMGVAITGVIKVPAPIHFPFLFLGLLTSFIQAFVFSLLTTIYLALLLSHEHEHDEAHGNDQHKTEQSLGITEIN